MNNIPLQIDIKALQTLLVITQIIVSIKNDLVLTSYGELLVIKKNIVRNGSLWSNVVFKKEVISYSNNERLQLKPFIIHLLKAHKVMQQGCLCFHYYLATSITNFEFKFLQACYVMHTLGYTKWKYWSLTITKGI